MLGEDHPGTLASATGLAVDLRALGETQAARELDEDILARYRRVLGEDHPDTLISASNLAIDLRALGETQAARELDEDTLARQPPRARRGPPRHARLRQQPRHRPARAGRAPGGPGTGRGHPGPRTAACSARTTPTRSAPPTTSPVDLRALGDTQAARELDEDTLARSRRVLGEDHPDTLNSANNLAIDLRALGEHQAARELDEDTLARRRRVLGEDHPGTLSSANNLAADLRALGETEDRPG